MMTITKIAVKWRDLNCDDKTSESGGKWKKKGSEVKIFGEMYVLSQTDSNADCVWVVVQYVLLLLLLLLSDCLIAICFTSVALCYVLINCFVIFNLFVLCLLSCFVCFAFYFMCSVFLYCSVYCFSPCTELVIFYLCTILPTTATGWKPNCSK